MNHHPHAALVRSANEAAERGDLATFASFLDDDIDWHESTPGFEGDYRGSHEALALLNRVFEQTGMEVSDLSIRHILADDTHAVVLLETTATIGDRRYSGEYVDLYRLRDGKLTEHWHLAVDPKAEEKFFGS
jgi:ketosteroid isomerase-like protein